MSLIQTVSHIKQGALNSLVCPVVVRFGVQAIPASSLLIGEASLSSLLHFGVILPSPIGIELLVFPSKITYLLERRRLAIFRASAIPRKFSFLFRNKKSQQSK
jgi:hypothetical protein